MEKVRFTEAGETIPTLSEKPIKSLGKTFNSSLKDTAAKQKTIKDLEEWLRKIDKSGLPGRFRAWLFQHAVLSWILWPLLAYDILITTVESLERAISNLVISRKNLLSSFRFGYFICKGIKKKHF